MSNIDDELKKAQQSAYREAEALVLKIADIARKSGTKLIENISVPEERGVFPITGTGAAFGFMHSVGLCYFMIREVDPKAAEKVRIKLMEALQKMPTITKEQFMGQHGRRN